MKDREPAARKNFRVQLLSSAASKLGDELASARLVLTWLLSSIAAPVFLTGLLVPIREAGALLPQLYAAGHIERAPIRKWFWVVGSALQGVSVLAMAAVGATATGASAGWALLGLLLLFSLARGVCSVSYKDVLGKTVPRRRRGTLMGYATAAAGAMTVAVGLLAHLRGRGQGNERLLLGMLLAAGALWIAASLSFSRLREAESATAEDDRGAVAGALRSLRLLATDSELRWFVLTRTAMLSTALAFPFFVLQARLYGDASFSGLGLMVVASGLARAISAPVWGRLADRSSRRVLVAAGAMAGVLGLVTFFVADAELAVIRSGYYHALVFLLLGVAHSGVRLGRKTYLVDMATEETRASYVAVSNTVIGVAILVLGGALGLFAELVETRHVILLLGAVALCASLMATRLAEAE